MYFLAVAGSSENGIAVSVSRIVPCLFTMQDSCLPFSLKFASKLSSSSSHVAETFGCAFLSPSFTVGGTFNEFTCWQKEAREKVASTASSNIFFIIDIFRKIKLRRESVRNLKKKR